MTRNRYSIGDKVLVSRDESGENHEPAEVVDSYELIIGEERRPTVVVAFEDGERKYMTATTPNVLPVEPEVDEAEESEVSEAEDAVDEAVEIEPSGNGTVTFVIDEEGSP